MATETFLQNVDNIIVVMSGKGGVGKSTTTALLVHSILTRNSSTTVGVLDLDLCGPSMPRLLGLENEKIVQSNREGTDRWLPVTRKVAENKFLKLVSIDFLLPNKKHSIVWRGPKKQALINQFFNKVDWGKLDYFIIDTPPGTSDEHLAMVENMEKIKQKIKTILVTTPQKIACLDVQKEIDFCFKVSLPIAGIVENMGCYICDCCSEITFIFSSNKGGLNLAIKNKIKFLGSVPIDENLTIYFEEMYDEKKKVNFIQSINKSKLIQTYKEIIEKILD